MRNSRTYGRAARILEIYPSTKGVLCTCDIIIVTSRHIECVVGIQKNEEVREGLELTKYQRKQHVVMKFIHYEKHIVFNDVGRGRRKKSM